VKTEAPAQKAPPNPSATITKAVVYMILNESPRPRSDSEVLDRAFTIFESLNHAIVETYNERITREVLLQPLEAAIATKKAEAVLEVLLTADGFDVLARLHKLRAAAQAAAEVATPPAPETAPAENTQPVATGE
jgi:hypothetical protein